MSSRRRWFLSIATCLVMVAGLVTVLRAGDGGGGAQHVAAGACQKGFVRLSDEYLRELRQGARAGTGRGEADGGVAGGAKTEHGRTAPHAGKAAVRGVCLNARVKRPEPFKDLTKANTSANQRLGFDTPTQYALAARAKRRLASTSIPGTAGTWTPLGKGPLIFDDPSFPDNFGLSRGAGRITDYAYDDAGKRLFAAVAQGGVWASTDRGAHWTSIGDQLPTQIVGAVGYTPAGGGTVIAVTGDNAFGGNTFGGMGVFWSDDVGKTWHKSSGAPDGAMGFRVAVRPDQPDVLYAATGAGLYRSTDAGRSFADVALPTGDCAEKTFTKKGCFLANVVTDVQAQGPDDFGHTGGAVVASVGWRAGPKKNADGSVQAPANGIYVSDSGAAGSFRKTPDSAGFTPTDRVGRVSLGSAYGPKQNHGYLFALVQDAKLFNSGKLEGLDIGSLPDPLGLGLDLTATPTYIDGVYESRDFGRHWTKITNRLQFLNPANGSTLAQLSVLGFGPGIQSWYNSWIQPDPYAQAGGVPTRLALGLEEVFESRTGALGLPQALPLADFQAVGPYAVGGGGCLITLTGQICGQLAQKADTHTLHPDQHGAIFLPDAKGSTLVAGNDGGNYVQKVPSTGPLTPAGFGKGADEGFNTLLPYGLSAAKDGTIYAGLQDNGTIKLEPKTGRQLETLGGDGTFALTDPEDSNQALAATPNGGFSLTHDGGRKYDDVTPPDLRNAQFLTPFVFDDKSTARVGLAGRNVFVADAKLADLTSHSFKQVYDLGTAAHRGDQAAASTDTDPPNVASAMALRDDVGYVGFCGSCDPVKDNLRFRNGIATNANGGTWHIAKADGLPQRVIDSLAIDPANTSTVYVALGTSTVRPYAPAQALGDDGTDPAGGHVYKSTDGGETFRDISGDLPNIGATWLLVRGQQILAATTVGVFASATKDGGTWGLLGKDLPAAPVFSMTMDPADPNRLLIASFGRGLYSYTFKDPPAACRDRTAPVTRFGKGARTAGRARRLRLHGTSSDRGCGRKGAGKVRRVTISIARVQGKRCAYLQSNGRLARHATSCKRPHYVRVRGTAHWTFTARRALPRGTYRVRVRATDTAHNVERLKARNAVRLSVRRR